MTPEQFSALKPGDLVRHKSSPDALIVHANYGTRVTAVRTADLTNPIEWDVVSPAGETLSDAAPRPTDAEIVGAHRRMASHLWNMTSSRAPGEMICGRCGLTEEEAAMSIFRCGGTAAQPDPPR